jgi:hypothetical protein
VLPSRTLREHGRRRRPQLHDQQPLDHASIRTTRRYAHLVGRPQPDADERIGSRPCTGGWWLERAVGLKCRRRKGERSGLTDAGARWASTHNPRGGRS